MRIVVFGGSGEVGTTVSRDLAACEEVSDLVIADVNPAGVDAVVRNLPRPNVTGVAVDVRDREKALRLLAGADLLMNCTSFSLFDDVIEVALAARVNYADLISEPTALQRRRAQEAGITAVSGLGLTPGASNVLVSHAAQEMDELQEVHISWVSLRTIAPTPGGLDTILWELSDECPTRQYFHNGRYVHAAFMEVSRVVDFAPPVRRQRVYVVPHTEVQTLPSVFPTLQFCAVRGTWSAELMDDVRVLNKYGLLTDTTMETTKACIWDRVGGERGSAPSPLFLNLEVVGLRGGETICRTYDVSHPIDWGQEGLGRMTGRCAAVGAQLLGRHGQSGAGFVSPEAYYDPQEFVAELRTRAGVTMKWGDRRLVTQAAERH